MAWPSLFSAAVVVLVLLSGAYLTEYLHGVVKAGPAHRPASYNPLLPGYRAALRLAQQSLTTEHPDTLNRCLAPALYFALATLGMALAPWSVTFTPLDLSTGVVLWGAVEVLATLVIFLFGWSANTPMALLGAYRYVALGLSCMLVSMFVLIGVALPAESLRFSEVVNSQAQVWNVLRQPLGLPLFLIVGLGLSFWGPLNFACPRDLGGGCAADSSGPAYLIWQLARRAMLVAFAVIAASAFLGGWQGPLLPGPVWLALKALLVLAVLLLMGRLLPMMTPEKFLSFAWLVLLPLAFVDLVWAGVLAL